MSVIELIVYYWLANSKQSVMVSTRSACVRRLTLFGVAEHFPLSIITVQILNARLNYLRFTKKFKQQDALIQLNDLIVTHYRTVFGIEPCSRPVMRKIVKKELDKYHTQRGSEHRNKKDKSDQDYFEFDRKLDFQRGGSKLAYQDFRNVNKQDYYLYEAMLNSECKIKFAKITLEYTQKLERRKRRVLEQLQCV